MRAAPCLDRLCRAKGLLAGVAVALVSAACGSPYTAEALRARPYISKLELSLDVSSIPDRRTRHAAYSAVGDIEETIGAMSHPFWSPDEISARIRWDSEAPLLLPKTDPPYRLSDGRVARNFYVFMGANSWRVDADGMLSFVARFNSAIRRDSYDEKQVYEFRNCRWKLVAQYRLEYPEVR